MLLVTVLQSVASTQLQQQQQQQQQQQLRFCFTCTTLISLLLSVPV